MSYEEAIDKYQDDRNQPLPRDTDPVRPTIFEAEKCAAIIDAYIGGLILYRDAVRAVHLFLRARAHEGMGHCVPSAEVAWLVIAEAPWPPPRHMWPDQTPL